jgi:hypothetical protein
MLTKGQTVSYRGTIEDARGAATYLGSHPFAGQTRHILSTKDGTISQVRRESFLTLDEIGNEVGPQTVELAVDRVVRTVRSFGTVDAQVAADAWAQDPGDLGAHASLHVRLGDDIAQEAAFSARLTALANALTWAEEAYRSIKYGHLR